MMADDIDWIEEIVEFDGSSANVESRIVWLKLGRTLSAWAETDHIDDSRWADECIAMVARAEACFWRASGDAQAIDIDQFLPLPRNSDGNRNGENAEGG